MRHFVYNVRRASGAPALFVHSRNDTEPAWNGTSPRRQEWQVRPLHRSMGIADGPIVLQWKRCPVGEWKPVQVADNLLLRAHENGSVWTAEDQARPLRRRAAL